MQTDHLKHLIDQKLAVLTQIRQLADRQTLLVAEGNVSALLGLLAAKQKLLAILQRRERELDQFREDDPEQRVWRSPQARQEARQAAQRCQTLLDEIMQIEQRCETEMVRRRDTAAENLQGAHLAAQAQRAYVDPAGNRPQQIDLSSES